MLFDWNAVAAPGQVQDVQPCAPLTLTGDGLWVCLVSSGRCTASVPSAGPLPAGAALLLPPQSVPAGHLVLSRAPLVLEPEGSCHLLCVQLTGQASAQFLAGLHELPFLARGETCPAAAELLDRLASEQDLPGRVRSQLAFALLCELADADSAAPALPPLVQAAIADIRANYAGLYGVEELSERLGVSKSTARQYLLELREAGRLVRVGTRYYPAGAVADPDDHLDIIRAYLQEHGTGRRQDFIRLLGLEPEQGTLLLRRLTDRGELVLSGRHYTLPEQEK